MTRNQTIIAILKNAIEHLWDGSAVDSRRYSGGYRKKPEYMCHAVEFAIAEIVYGDREKLIYIYSEEQYGHELKQKIMYTIPGSSTADSYCRDAGITTTDVGIQEFRKKALESLLAFYQAKEQTPVKPSVLVRHAIAKNFDTDGRREGNSSRSLFTCIAVVYAADELEKGGMDVTDAVSVVKERIAEAMGVPVCNLGGSTYDTVLIRVLGSSFVRAQGFEWVQERRKEMLVRIAERLEREGK